jgi:hypothetical protein
VASQPVLRMMRPLVERSMDRFVFIMIPERCDG